MAGLVVDDEFIDGGFGVEILALQILKRFRGGDRAGGRSDGDVGLPGCSCRRLQGDAFQGKRISRVQAKRRPDGGQVLGLLNGGACVANFHRQFRSITSEPVAVDSDDVAPGRRSCVGQNLEDLRAIAEGVGSEGEPAVGKIGRDIYCAGGSVWGRGCIDLCSACNGGVCDGLGAEEHLCVRYEVLSCENRRRPTCVRTFGRLRGRHSSENRGDRGKRDWTRGVDKAQAAIGDAETKVLLRPRLQFPSVFRRSTSRGLARWRGECGHRVRR